MVELEKALRSLVEHPHRLPDPVEELERRATVRPRRRARQRVTAVIVVLAVLGSLSVLAGLREGATAVDTGPVDQPGGPPTTRAVQPSRAQGGRPLGLGDPAHGG